MDIFKGRRYRPAFVVLSVEMERWKMFKAPVSRVLGSGGQMKSCMRSYPQLPEKPNVQVSDTTGDAMETDACCPKAFLLFKTECGLIAELFTEKLSVANTFAA